MSKPRLDSIYEETIVADGNTFIGEVPYDKQGVAVKMAGTFDSADVTLGYAQKDGTVVAMQTGTVSLSAAGELVNRCGSGVQLYLITANVDTAAAIKAQINFW